MNKLLRIPGLGESASQSAPEENLPAVVAIGGTLTIKQLAGWYRPVLATDKSSDLPPEERFVAPYKGGRAEVEEMREDLATRLERIHSLTQRKLLLVGHSLGGLMASMAAVEHPDMVAGVVSLGGAHAGIKRHTAATRALKTIAGNPKHAGIIMHDSDFMQEHQDNMSTKWPEGVSFDVISTFNDIFIPPPQGLSVELSDERKPANKLLVPAVPGAGIVIQRAMGIPEHVEFLPTRFPTGHVNLPHNPSVLSIIRARRLQLAGLEPLPSSPWPGGQRFSSQPLPAAA